ncbi:MAG: hypothetical protein CK533_04525 [Acidobacterium sp.]|nr:PIN domain-containing protein [Acidobacteriota bacterium]PHY11512.1 MAG: hypothetical protein CK533_04525 [Acidobacterium sp.]
MTRRPRGGDGAEPVSFAGGAILRYIESSALVSALLDEDESVRLAVRGDGQRFASALTLCEASRAILRARIEGRLSAEYERAALRRLRQFERRCEVVAISVPVLVRAARPFPVEPIRTLDAIHLATVEESGETPQLVTIVTRDRRIRENAIAMGYTVE